MVKAAGQIYMPLVSCPVPKVVLHVRYLLTYRVPTVRFPISSNFVVRSQSACEYVGPVERSPKVAATCSLV